MKQTIIRIIFATALITGSINTSIAQTPEQQYQKGLVKEEGEGALQDAMNLYKQVADNTKADQSIRAKALLHIGMCHEKLGTQEAIKTYQLLVASFPSQKNEVTVARERLSRLSPTPSLTEISIRQIWSGQEADDFGSVSADGEYLSYADWKTGNLAIRNLKTGENKQITNEGTWKDSTQFVEFSLVSPDGKQFAYTWYNKNLNYELRLFKNGNQKPVTLYSCSGFDEYITPDTWFSDGKRLIARKYNNKTRICQVISINTITREIGLLKEMISAPSIWANLSLSPDEKYLSYDFPSTSGNSMYDINLLSLDTKDELHLVDHPSNDRLLGWLPSGNAILFVSDRSGTNDVYAIPYSNGKPVSMPKRVLTNIGEINPMGFTFNGSMFFSVLNNVHESFIVPLDSKSGSISINSRTSVPGPKFGCNWLPDGESMICCQYRQSPEARRNRKFNLAVLNSKTGESRILAGSLNILGLYRLSPDSKSVLAFGREEQRMNEKDYNGGIYKVDIETGALEEVKIKQDASVSLSCEWDKEGKNIFYISKNQIIKHNPETGDEKVIFTGKGMYYPALTRSYDGNNLLLDVLGGPETVNLFKLLSVPVNGGDADTLCTYQADMNPGFRRIDVSPDGKYIYFSTRVTGMNSILCRIPATGGTIQNLWQSENCSISGLDIHPDGKRIAISTSGEEYATEIRSIDNLNKKIAEIFANTK